MAERGGVMAKSASWRKLREEMIDWHGEACQHCGDEKARLSVHHRYYESGKKKWEYPLETLELLCPKCHGKADERRRRIVRATGYLDGAEAKMVMGYMAVMRARCMFPQDDLRIDLPSWEFAKGVGDALGIAAEDVVTLGHARRFVMWLELRRISHSRFDITAEEIMRQ